MLVIARLSLEVKRSRSYESVGFLIGKSVDQNAMLVMATSDVVYLENYFRAPIRSMCAPRPCGSCRIVLSSL